MRLTTVLHRVAVATGRATVPVPAWGAGDVVGAVAARRRAGLPPEQRDRFEALRAAAGPPGRAAVVVLDRVLATSGSVDAVAALAEVWDDLAAGERAATADPVGRLARVGRQGDATTCGSAALTMLAAAGDPRLALWLASGRVLRGPRPPELAAAPDDALAALTTAPPQRRFAAVHRVLKHRTGRARVRWPAALGTPPWGAADVGRFPGVAFRPVVVDEGDPGHLGAVLDAVGGAIDRGVPVPLYTGGDHATGGWAAAVPRHVVLAVRHVGEGLDLWEPGAGRVVRVTRSEIAAGGRPHAALGGWSHLVWALLPEPADAGR